MNSSVIKKFAQTTGKTLLKRATRAAITTVVAGVVNGAMNVLFNEQLSPERSRKLDNESNQ